MIKPDPRPLCEHRTYNPWDPASSGYDIAIYEDHAILVRHTSTPGDHLGRTLRARVPDYVYDAIGRRLAEVAPDSSELVAAIRTWVAYGLAASQPKMLRPGRTL